MRVRRARASLSPCTCAARNTSDHVKMSLVDATSKPCGTPCSATRMRDPAQALDALLRRFDGRRRVGGARDPEERDGDAVEPVLVAAERGIERLAEVRHVTHHAGDARVGQHRLRRLPERGRESRTGEQQRRFGAEARAEHADARRIDVRGIPGIGEHAVQRELHAERAQRLHRDERLEIEQRVCEVVEVLEPDVGDARVGLERRDHDIAVAREHGERVDVIVRDRTAAEAVAEEQDRKARRPIGEERQFRAALHVRHAASGGQHVIGTGIVGRGGIADEHDVRHALAGVVAVEIAIVRHDDVELQRLRRLRQQVGDVARTTAVGNAFPVRLHVLARAKAREILRDVGAADRIRPEAERRHRARLSAPAATPARSASTHASERLQEKWNGAARPLS